MLNHKCLFLADIADGYSLRNTICMLKNETNEITLLVSKTKITITFVNKGQYAVHNLVILGSELSNYIYNITDGDEHPFIVSTTELFNVTKMISRKDGIKIFWTGGEKLSLQPIKSRKETGQTGPSFINIINKEYEKYTFIESEYLEPSVKMQNLEFSEIFSRSSTLKCKHMEMDGYVDAMVLKAILHDGTCGLLSTFGNPQRSLISERLVNIKIPINTIKTLSKLNNISPPSTLLKFSFLANTPVKIESKIGTYGIYQIYLRDAH